ncbi:MAG: transcription antitermination factor NusB [Phycisphaerae bacterium]
MSFRHRARRLALQGLCCLDVQGARAGQQVRQFIDESVEAPAVLSTAHQLLADTLAQQADCDGLLVRHAKHWDLARLALVDRNILRLAVCELREGTTPPKVVITEAIHLAQEFSTAESPRFVNGVLDAIMRELIGNVPPADQTVESSGDGPAPPNLPTCLPDRQAGQAGPEIQNPNSEIHNPQ